VNVGVSSDKINVREITMTRVFFMNSAAFLII